MMLAEPHLSCLERRPHGRLGVGSVRVSWRAGVVAGGRGFSPPRAAICCFIQEAVVNGVYSGL